MASKSVILYSKSRCVQCDATVKHLDRNETEYLKKDATTEESMTEIIALGANYTQAPVIVVMEDGVIVDHWSGYNPDKVNTLIL